MSDGNETCEYVLDPDDSGTWEGKEGQERYIDEEILNDDGVWTCPHNVEEGEKMCIFHQDLREKDDNRVTKAFYNTITDAKNNRDGQFLGAKFGNLKLDEQLNISVKLDLTLSSFENISVRSVICRNEAIFRCVNISGDAKFSGAEFRQEADFSKVNFGGSVSFVGATFEDNAIFFAVTIKNNSKFGWGSNFQKDAIFRGASFNGDADFEHAQFQGRADFDRASFDGSASFFSTDFNRGANFPNSVFKQDADFRLAEFSQGASFVETQFDQNPDFRKIDLSSFRFDKADLTDADFTEANLCETSFESALLSRATLFDADLRGAKLNGAVLGDIRINEETQFLGHPENDSGFSPHTLSAIRSRPCCVYDPKYEENNAEADVNKAKSVYRALEELARRAARPKLQSQCFVRRQDLQKDGYKRDAKAAYSLQEKLIAGARYSRAKVTRATLLYGESPWRVISSSTGFIVLVAFLYPLGEWLRPIGGKAMTYSRILGGEPGLLLESLYFSALTFTTLGMGDYQPMGLGQVLATLNTTLGAVLIALLVFVLGRRAAR